MRSLNAVAALALALVSTTTLHAETAELLPSDDTSLFESSPEWNYNFGAQRDIPIGTTGSPNGLAKSRGLFRFDLAAAVPAGSTINSAIFELTVERPPSAGASSSFELRRMLVSWIEGTKINNERPGGAAASSGEPTWNHRESPSTAWGGAGGLEGTDYSATSSGEAMVLAGDARGDTYTWTLNATGVADLQAMLDTPVTNFGWMLLTASESTAKTARRFYTKETLTDFPIRQGLPPKLNIDYSPPVMLEAPEVTAFSYDGLNIALQFFAEAGINYAVQVSDSLEDAEWSTVESFSPLVDGPLSSSIPSSADVRKFVRVLGLRQLRKNS